MSYMKKLEYDELHGYEPMMYRPENWEKFDKRQKEEFEFYKNQLKELGYVPQVEKIVVSNHEDFLSKKEGIEKEDGFVRWFG